MSSTRAAQVEVERRSSCGVAVAVTVVGSRCQSSIIVCWLSWLFVLVVSVDARQRNLNENQYRHTNVAVGRRAVARTQSCICTCVRCLPVRCNCNGTYTLHHTVVACAMLVVGAVAVVSGFQCVSTYCWMVCRKKWIVDHYLIRIVV